MTPIARRAVVLAFACLAVGLGRSVTLSEFTPQDGASGVVLGRVIDVSTGQPVPHATVTVATSGGAASRSGPGAGGFRQVADDRGRFAFDRLPAATFGITATHSGYLSGAFGRLRHGGQSQPLRLAAGERRTDITILLFPPAVISGIVRDDLGDPVVAVPVHAYRRSFVDGRYAMRREGHAATTDDRGAYRLFGLPPGEFIVGVPTIASGPLAGLAGGYFPASVSQAHAQRVIVSAGEDRSGIDVFLRHRAVRAVTGRVVGAERPDQIALELVPVDDEGAAGDAAAGLAPVGADGAFEFHGVAAGRYIIRARPAQTRESRTGPPLWSQVEVVSAGDDLRDVIVPVQAALVVVGRLEFDGLQAPSDMARITVRLESVGRGWCASGPENRPDDRQVFAIQCVPGRYVLTVSGVPSGWSLRSAVVGGVDVSDTPLDLERRDVRGLVVTLVDRSAVVKGIVQDARNQPDADAAVALFPFDRSGWTPWGPSPRRHRIVRASPEGEFAFENVPDGAYLLSAFSETLAGSWPEPTLLDVLSRSAAQIVVTGGVNVTQNLSRAEIRLTSTGRDRASHSASGLPAPVGTVTVQTGHGPSGDDDVQQPRDSVPAAGGTGSIGGIVVIEDSGDEPLRRAQVSVREMDGQGRGSSLTDEAGMFRIANLPAGRYLVIVSKPGFLTTYFGSKLPGRGPGAAVVLVEGQTLDDVRVSVPRGAVVHGTIRDRFGGPAVRVTVAAFRLRVRDGRRSVSAPSLAETDDRGAFRIFGLAPGSYVVVALQRSAFSLERDLTEAEWQQISNESRRAPADAAQPVVETPARPGGQPLMGHAPVYFPSVMSLAAAQSIEIGAGMQVGGIDLSIRLVPYTMLEGIAHGVRSGGSLEVWWTSHDSVLESVHTVRPTGGRFASDPLPPGRYEVRARETLPSGPTQWAKQEVDLLGPGSTQVPLFLQAGGVVAGRVVFNGDSPVPARDHVRVVLTPIDSDSRLALPGQAIGPDGRFTFDNVPPGPYRIGLGSSQGPWALRSARLGDRELLDSTLDVAPGESVQDLRLALTDRQTELVGVLADRDGRPVTDLTVVVFSADTALWSQSLPHRARPPVQPATDGRFRFRGLAQGDYLLAVTTAIEAADLTDPAVLEALAASAVRVTLVEGRTTVQNLAVK